MIQNKAKLMWSSPNPFFFNKKSKVSFVVLRILYNEKEITWWLGDRKFLVSC